MKSCLFNAVMLCGALSAWAQTVNFEPSLPTAFEKAMQQHKIVFVEYYNAECPVCKKLEPVFTDVELSKFYNENFINYKLNTEHIKKEDSLFIQNAGLKFESVPYFLFFDCNKHFVHYSGTKQDISYLINAAKTALNPTERSSNLVNKYDAGDRSIKTLYAYSNLLELYKADSLRNIIANELFAVFPEDELGTEKSYIITKNSVNDIENGFFKYWIDHVDEIKTFEKNTKSAHEINVLANILLKSINSPARNDWDLSKIKKVKEMILKTGLSQEPDGFFWEQESKLLVKEKHDSEAMGIFKKRMEKDADNTTASLYDIEFYLNIIGFGDDLKLIKFHLDRLSKKVMNKNDNAAWMFCNILYYKKVNDMADAKKLYKQAITYYKTNNINADKLRRLLN